MGKKKGGAKNKLAKMSEEEKARYLQHRADLEEEARRRKQQLICLYMKNKLKREEAFSRLNLAKINQQWRNILRQIKCKELQNEIIEVQKLFEDSFERKNRIIRRLLSDLDESEDLYSTLMQSHMENIERLMNLQEERLTYFRTKFKDNKDLILAEWNKEFEQYKADHNKSKEQLECVFYNVEDIIKKESAEQEENHLKKVDEIRSEMAIKLEDITKSREEKLELLWNEYEKILNDYSNYIETFYVEYIDLRERDDKNTELIRQNCYEITKLTEKINELKLIYENTEDEYNFQINYLKNTKNQLKDEYLKMKFDFENNLKLQNDKFKFMTVKSYSVISTLKNNLQQSENLLKLADECHKLETESEEILPFGFSQKKLSENQFKNLKEPPEEFKKNEFESLLNFENFWIRVNRVEFDIVCLKEEKLELKRENDKLKNLLKDYFIEHTLDNGSCINAENRIINRPQSMKIEKILYIDLDKQKKLTNKKIRPVTCIEGNLSNAVRTSKLNERKLFTPQTKCMSSK